MTEKTFRFIAEVLDGEFIKCDDGYVLCFKNTLKYKDEKKLKGGIDFIFDEDGVFEGIKSCS
jgi:hypothetical protein